MFIRTTPIYRRHARMRFTVRAIEWPKEMTDGEVEDILDEVHGAGLLTYACVYTDKQEELASRHARATTGTTFNGQWPFVFKGVSFEYAVQNTIDLQMTAKEHMAVVEWLTELFRKSIAPATVNPSVEFLAKITMLMIGYADACEPAPDPIKIGAKEIFGKMAQMGGMQPLTVADILEYQDSLYDFEEGSPEF